MMLLPFEGNELLSESTALDQRDRAIATVTQHAEDHAPGFVDRAAEFIVDYLHVYGPTAGEVLTLACKNSGIRPHDDRAFGAVYLRLAREGRIQKVGNVKRLRGNGTSGGNVWGLV